MIGKSYSGILKAYIEDENKKRIIDFNDSNLHVLGYSCPIDKWIDFEELDKHLYSIKDQPDVIPYVTFIIRRGGDFV